MAQLETFFDNFLVEEIPVEDAYSFGILGADGKPLVRIDKQSRKSQFAKILSCDYQFPRSGVMVQNPYGIGDIVMTSEFGRDEVVFTIEDEKKGAVKRYLIRFDDIRGRVPSA